VSEPLNPDIAFFMTEPLPPGVSRNAEEIFRAGLRAGLARAADNFSRLSPLVRLSPKECALYVYEQGEESQA
jgi:hypothetical protein